MADLYKVSWFFAYGRGGFSTSHYRMADGYDESLTRAKELLETMMALMGTGVRCSYVRVSRVDTPGDARISALDYLTIGNGSVLQSDVMVKSILNDSADTWWQSVLLRLGSSATVWGHQFLRGIPDSLVVNAGLSNDPNWDLGCVRYFKKLETDGWGMIGIARSNTSRKPITKIVVDPVLGATITTFPAHGLGVGNKFRISQFKAGALSNVNGTWIVDGAPTINTITVGPMQAAMNIIGPVTSWGLLWSLVRGFVPYVRAASALMRVTERKAGRPFDSLVGRRKTKARV